MTRMEMMIIRCLNVFFGFLRFGCVRIYAIADIIRPATKICISG